MGWYVSVLKRYVDFKGRAGRKEFWTYYLINEAISGVLFLIGTVLDIPPYLFLLWALATLLPTLSVGARRLHDAGKTGWAWLIGCIPLIGWIILLVLFSDAPDRGPNKYGPLPPVSPDAAQALRG